jgi:hypothetical protein
MTRAIVSAARCAGLVACATAIVATLSCRAAAPTGQTFASPEDAAKELIAVAKRGSLDELMKLLGPEAQPLVESSDPQVARQNRQVFIAAAAEGWRLEENGPDGRTLIVGNESWPFPVPLVKDGARWRFDTAAGVEEVMARRIGRNELSAIRVCKTYVFAQRLYASRGHDGKPAGLYATALRSDPGKRNGLYWQAGRGEKRSPLGDLIAESDDPGKPPFHGYRFKLVKSGGAIGVALLAWPATYDSTGVMTFVVADDGIVRQKDLGPDTERAARALDASPVDSTWEAVN